jgi:cation transport ATPase
MKKILVAIAIPLLAMIGTVSAQSAEIVIQTTAQCGECKEIIEKALMAEKGVKFAELNIQTKQVKVVYNAKKTNPEQLRKTISGVGYDADEIVADPEAVKKLNPCCTKDGHRE